MILEVDSSMALLAFIGKILDIIHLLAPIVLIVFVTIDLVKAVASQDNEMVSKTIHSIKNRIIACLVIFFLPTIVEVVFSRVFISLNMDEDEYNKILSTYKAVINPEQIDIQDDTKNNEISSNMMYSMTTEDISKDALKNEVDFSNYSKTLTHYIFEKKSFKSFVSSIVTSDFLINYKDRTYKLSDEFFIKYDDISVNEAIDNDNYVISNVTVSNAVVNGKDKYDNLVINYYYIKIEDNYKLQKVSLEAIEKIDNYLQTIKSNENLNEINATSRYVSSNVDYDYSKLDKLSDTKIKAIYNKNIGNIVALKTISYSATVNLATGFFISDGVVATSWSYLQSSFMLGQTIIITDSNKNTYKCDGIVAIDAVNDVVVLKLNKQVKRSVNFASKEQLQKNDPIISITTKTGIAFSTVTGIVSSNDTNLISVLPVSRNDWGSPVFNESGNVVGITTSKLINSELSSASTIEQLQKLKSELDKTSFKDIKITSIDEIKKTYYYKGSNKEQIKNSIPQKKWKKVKKIGDIENSIVLDLVKTSYYDDVISLRYQNPTSNYLDNISYASDFIANLESSGYKKISESNEKIMYKKGSKQVIIMNEFDYLIVIISIGGVL